MMARCKSLVFALLFPAFGAAVLVSSGKYLPAQSAQTCTLTVKVSGIHDTDGNVKVTVRSDANTVVQSRVVEIDAKTMTATAVLENLAPGTYAVSAFHDENKNGKLDFNDVGMPMEGYGHSNNPAKRMGPPSFDETKFNLNSAKLSLEIQLIYWP